MKKNIFNRTLSFFILVATGFAGIARAEDVTTTSYYPIPYGEYKTLTTTGDTSLVNSGAAKVGIGQGVSSSFPNQNAILDISSTSKGLLLPRPTTIPSALNNAGLLIYNSTTNRPEFSDGVNWIAFGGSSSGPWSLVGANDIYNSDLGNVGISDGSSFTPLAKFHIKDGAILSTSPSVPSGTVAPNTPALDAGTRMMWIGGTGQAGPFRAGVVTSTQWDGPVLFSWPALDNSLGSSSFAVGRNSKARFPNTVAFGDGHVIGQTGSQYGGIGGIAMGLRNTVLENESIAIGSYITTGTQNWNYVRQVCIGRYLSAATASYGVLIGTGISDTQQLSISTFQAIAIGFNSTTPTLFMSNVSNGNVGINTITPAGDLDVNGDIYCRIGSSTTPTAFPDYIFNPDYSVESIDEHAAFMWKNCHLTAIRPFKKDEKGQDIVDLSSHAIEILEELEKAHIYIEQLNNRVKALESKIENGAQK